MAVFDLKDRKLRAVNDKLVVEKAVRPNKSAGGLFLPDEDVRVYCEGKVLSVGPKCECGAKVGDQVIWQVFKGQAAGHHDEQRWCIEDKDVLAIIEPAGVHDPVGSKCTLPHCPEPHIPAEEKRASDRCDLLVSLPNQTEFRCRRIKGHVGDHATA